MDSQSQGREREKVVSVSATENVAERGAIQPANMAMFEALMQARDLSLPARLIAMPFRRH